MRSLLVGVLLLLSPAALPGEGVSGTRVAERTTKALTKISWAGSLDQVLERARKERKLVFWLQIVGELDGGL